MNKNKLYNIIKSSNNVLDNVKNNYINNTDIKHNASFSINDNNFENNISNRYFE